eukprot:TRINITY_DN61727_c0_g1_i1.p1 TRINITY_DN61727_c0_g1~~TRINITY_DN61727_c0_g1_i1.p1  ORF type:complete len:745 (+),score=46.34 TRINITY_DN61727_c0_g1_i1:120-2354(+)
MFNFATGVLIAATLVNTVMSECANACNGHGKCTAYDMCICNRNYQGNDCSQRVCQFGIAHVDTPKGDLDGDGTVSGPNTHVVDNHPVYPYGTREQFPQMEDTDLNPLTNSGHYYMECSNKGTCNRATGECVCLDGYDGVACQRASCPGFPASCSGHGTCKTISQLAEKDYGNSYKLWDRSSTMGCDCDPGYYGPDCSLRDCKYGVDPLYLDDAATAKVGIYDFGVLSTNTTGTGFSNGVAESGPGQWAIRFFDSHGEDWLTAAITARAGCDEVVAALEGLPNNVIPVGSIECHITTYNTGLGYDGVTTPGEAPLQWTGNYTVKAANGAFDHLYQFYYRMAQWVDLTSGNDPELDANLPNSFMDDDNGAITDAANAALQSPKYIGDIYRIKFRENPGALREPQIELYLDGKRPSLTAGFAGGSRNKVVTFVVTDGQQGEDKDYFADHCDGVTVTIDQNTNAGQQTGYVALGGLDTAETKLLKACLGDADGDSTTNVEVYDWDYGTVKNPHIIKLVRTVTSFNDGGYYAALMYTGSVFRLFNPFVPPDVLYTDSYDVYTTKGTLAKTSDTSKANFPYGGRYFFTDSGNQLTDDTDANWSGDLACETNADIASNANLFHCLNRSDIITIFSDTSFNANPPYLNLYTVKRIWTKPYKYVAQESADLSSDLRELKRGTHVIETDLSLNWGGDDNANPFYVYKFMPADASTYNYVAPCSNRGICNTDTGLCQCFPGYTNDDCSVQNSLAL